MPAVSVIIPAYNVEKYLKRCMDSVRRQTFTDYEVLLIDDGSTDGTPQLCDRIAAEDPRIHVFHKENGGLADARNFGLDRMRGETVTFIDSDDYVSDRYLETLCGMMKKLGTQISALQGQVLTDSQQPADSNAESIAGSGAKRNEGRKAGRDAGRRKAGIADSNADSNAESNADSNAESNAESIAAAAQTLTAEEAIRKMLLRQGLTHTCWGKLYKASLWKSIRFPKGQNYEDYAVNYHVFSQAQTVACSDRQLYYYIQREGSIMHAACSKKTLTVLDVSDRVSAFLLKRWPRSRPEILALQTHTYLKNLQMILNTGRHAFPEYQERILRFVRKNAPYILRSGRIPLRDKVKTASALLGRGPFLRLYNHFDGDLKL